jgi:hypothetical protein
MSYTYQEVANYRVLPIILVNVNRYQSLTTGTAGCTVQYGIGKHIIRLFDYISWRRKANKTFDFTPATMSQVLERPVCGFSDVVFVTMMVCSVCMGEELSKSLLLFIGQR